MSAAGGSQASIPDRARGAARIVVATVTHLNASLERNEFGDELIVSHLQLAIEETLKGDRQGALSLDVTGGTVNGVTLRVSSLPAMATGERAVFFLDVGRNGVYVPHLRGQGILKLDAADRVQGTGLTLAEVRRLSTGLSR
jgi:hypothetical protein